VNNCNIPLFLQINNSLNFLTQFIQLVQIILKYDNIILYTNIKTVMKDFVILKRYYVFCIRVKKYLIIAFIKMNSFWTLVSLLT